jgi:hypothetical protein
MAGPGKRVATWIPAFAGMTNLSDVRHGLTRAGPQASGQNELAPNLAAVQLPQTHG